MDARWERYRSLQPDFSRPVAEDARLLHSWHGESAGGQFGWVATGAGDVDGDGVEDMLTSAPFAAGADGAAAGGVVYVFSGRSGARLHRFEGPAGAQLGVSVAAPGDLDGDGRSDAAAGSFGGLVRAWSGADGAQLWEWRGDAAAQFGREVAAAGDWNLDGAADLLVSLPEHDGGRGALELRSGADGAVLLRREGRRPATISLRPYRRA